MLCEIQLMRKAAEIRKWLASRTTYNVSNDDINPFYARTNTGLVLIEYYNSPGSIGTPFGKWDVTSGGYDSRHGTWLKEAKDVLGLKLRRKVYTTEIGEFGPWWDITKDLNGESLPIATEYPIQMLGTYENEKILSKTILDQLDWKITEE